MSNTDMERFLPYVNVGEGVARIMNNKKLYAKLVRSFLTNTLMDDIDKDIETGNMEQAIYHAHTLKGTSANLSFPKLQDDAAAAEHGAKDGAISAEVRNALKESYDKTMGILDEVLASIEV